MTPSHTLQGVLFVGAHPDDETILAGGTLSLLHEQDIPTHVLCVTDGRGGEAGGVPDASDSPQALARVREQELRCAVQALRVNTLTLLGYEDPVVGPGEELYGFAADESRLVAQITDVIRSSGANVVLSHGTDGEYGHPAHIQVHQAVRRAVCEMAPHCLFYSTGAYMPTVEDRLWNKSDPAHIVLDITPWSRAKLAAMVCHRTQHELFRRRRKLQTVHEALRTLESFHRHWPSLAPGIAPDDDFVLLLLAAGAWRPEHPA